MINCVFENGNKNSLRHVVVHAIVEKGNKLLLEKRVDGLLEGGKWSLPSGFLERGETAKEGLLRELEEETGWQCEVGLLFRINTDPNRPHEDRQNVSLEFMVKPIRQVGKMDNESTKVEWVAIEDLPPLEEFAFDHGETIKLYLEYKRRQFQLPILI